MSQVKDVFGNNIDIGSLVAISTNSGMYVGRVTKFNYINDYYGNPKVSTVQVERFDGKAGRRKQSYDLPHKRMINLDLVVDYVESEGL